MSSHAILSASGSHRWLNCTPSARLELEFDSSRPILERYLKKQVDSGFFEFCLRSVYKELHADRETGC